MRLLTLNGLAAMAALGLVACATSTAASRSQTADVPVADDQAAAELREHHRHHHRGGAMQFIAMSLDTLGPDDAKRPQVERLQSDLHACMAPAGGIERKLLLTVADGVVAGVTDRAKIDATIVQLEAAAVAVRDCGAMALNQLHAILSPAEREELVEKVLAHWEVWQQANQEEEAAGRKPGGRLTELTRDVRLSSDQVERISAALRASREGHSRGFDRATVEAQVQAFAAAFVGESFDAKSINVEMNARLAAHGARRMVDFYETVTPLLTREQRAMLAEHLRMHADQQPSMSAN
jgi:Spy/CpxP family protein refolding chaperone